MLLWLRIGESHTNIHTDPCTYIESQTHIESDTDTHSQRKTKAQKQCTCEGFLPVKGAIALRKKS